MSWQVIIFSGTAKARLTRHVVFWLLMCLLFSLQSFELPSAGFPIGQAFYNLALCGAFFLPCTIFVVYAFLAFLYPAFLSRDRYLAFTAGFIIIILGATVLNYFAGSHYYQITAPGNYTPRQILVLGFSFVLWSVGAASVALTIKFLRERHLQQLRNASLALHNVQNEIQLIRASLQHRIIFQALTSIQNKIANGCENAPALILKLSDLLGYLLYETSKKQISLADEIDAVNNLLAIAENDLFRKNLAIKMPVDANLTKIRPTTLFHFFQSLTACQSGCGNACVHHISIRKSKNTLQVEMSADRADVKSDFWKRFAAKEISELNSLFKHDVNSAACILSPADWKVNFPLNTRGYDSA